MNPIIFYQELEVSSFFGHFKLSMFNGGLEDPTNFPTSILNPPFLKDCIPTPERNPRLRNLEI